MKIAVNTRFLLKGKLEGIGWVTYELLQRMVKAHPEDEFFFLFDRPYDPKFVFAENVRPLVLFPPARHPLLWWLWFERAVPKALKNCEADVFLSTDSYLSLGTSVKTAMICHDIAHVHFPEEIPFLVNQYYQHFVPRFLKRAEQVISVSHFTKADIIRQYAIDAEKIAVVHNACREGFIPLDETSQSAVRQRYAQGKPYFFYVGAVHPRKNVHRLITAFDQYKSASSASTQLLIGGRFAWQTGPVKTAYDQSSFREDIHFLGYLSEEALKQVLASALAFVYPSLFEGFGLPVLEAMHCGVPVITSKVSSLPEISGDAGILVDPTSIAQIANAMQQLEGDEKLRQKLVEKGNRQKEKFDWEQSAEQAYQLLRGLGQS
ncbi:MAG: glycosyltransferase family 1 protein [Bacteroidota bacterium]